MKVIHTSGKRKTAKARATITKGSGVVRVNKAPYQIIEPKFRRMKIEEALLIAEDVVSGVNIDVTVKGGGQISQLDAVALAIARGLVAWTGDEKLKRKYLDYDRHLLVADPRRKETQKPNRSSARSRRQKSYR